MRCMPDSARPERPSKALPPGTDAAWATSVSLRARTPAIILKMKTTMSKQLCAVPDRYTASL